MERKVVTGEGRWGKGFEGVGGPERVGQRKAERGKLTEKENRSSGR